MASPRRGGHLHSPHTDTAFLTKWGKHSVMDALSRFPQPVIVCNDGFTGDTSPVLELAVLPL